MALALDEPRDGDEVFEEQGFKFCIETELYNKAGDIIIDAGYMGFVVQSSNSLSGGNSNCGGCSGGCN